MLAALRCRTDESLPSRETILQESCWYQVPVRLDSESIGEIRPRARHSRSPRSGRAVYSAKARNTASQCSFDHYMHIREAIGSELLGKRVDAFHVRYRSDLNAVKAFRGFQTHRSGKIRRLEAADSP